jgi:ligand-binding sensor domain-containing protein
MRPFLYAYLFFFIGLFSTVYAQQNQTYFEKYDVKSGLPESSVNTMVEDHLGYIWMGTQNGLVRYDGYQYKVYQLGTKKTNLESRTSTSSIFIDKNKTVWIAARANGLFKYNRATDTFTQFFYPEKDIRTSYFIQAEDKAGNLWGTATKDAKESYLWKLDKNGKFEFFGKQFKNANYINATCVYSAFKATSGKLWFGTNNGIL